MQHHHTSYNPVKKISITYKAKSNQKKLLKNLKNFAQENSMNELTVRDFRYKYFSNKKKLKKNLF